MLKIHRILSRGRGAGDLTLADWRDILIYASACGAICATSVGTTTALESGKVEALVRRHGGGLAAAAKVAARG